MGRVHLRLPQSIIVKISSRKHQGLKRFHVSKHILANWVSQRLVVLSEPENREHLNLIFPVYVELMRQIPSISMEGAREVFLH